MNGNTKRIVTVSGPSCSGKTTLAHMLRNFYGLRTPQITTSRAITDEEAERGHIVHMSKVEIKSLENAGQAVFVTNKDGELTTVTRDALEKVYFEHRTPIIEINPEDAMKIREYALSSGIKPFAIYIDIAKTVVAKRLNEKLGNMDKVKEILSNEKDWLTNYEFDFVVDLSLSEDETFDEYLADIYAEIESL